MKKPTTKIMTAKRLAVAVATVCATLSAPVFASDDIKGLMDLLLKKGMITQQEYDQKMKASEDAAENQAFKEKRLSDDVTKLNKVAEKSKDTGLVMKNGLGIQSADGANTIALTGRVHFDARQYSQGSYQDRMEVRRARFGVKGQLLKDFKYEIIADLGQSGNSSTAASADDTGMSNRLSGTDVAYFEYVGYKPVQVRLGRFKMPFSLEQLTSSNNIDTIERSLMGQVEGEFVPAKETGAMIYGNPESGLTWALAASRGRTASNATTATADYIGRVTANIAELTGNKDFITHVGLAYSKGEVASATAIKSGRTEAREEDAFFTMNTSTALSGVTTRTRQGTELAFAYKGYKLQGEMFDVNYDSATGQSKDVKGYYTQAVWNVTGENHNYSNSSGTFGGIKPNSPFTMNGGTGALQLVVRYSELDGSGAGTLATGKTNGATAMTYGLNWVLNENARVMLNYIQTNFNSAVTGSGQTLTRQDAVVLRGQLAF
jgi:phosphate-selective porin OprO/OprP